MDRVPSKYQASGLDLLLLASTVIEKDAAESGLCESVPHWVCHSNAVSMEILTSENTSDFATSSGVTNRQDTAPMIPHQSSGQSGYSMDYQNSVCDDGLLDVFVDEDSEAGGWRSLSDASLNHSHPGDIGTPEYFL